MKIEPPHLSLSVLLTPPLNFKKERRRGYERKVGWNLMKDGVNELVTKVERKTHRSNTSL